MSISNRANFPPAIPGDPCPPLYKICKTEPDTERARQGRAERDQAAVRGLIPSTDGVTTRPELTPPASCPLSTAAELKGPHLSLIRLLHRHDDGYISFLVADGEGDIRSLVAIKASDLATSLPRFAPELLRNSFFSVNAGYGLADRSGAAHGPPLHNSESLRYLCAAYVDIDYYKAGLERWKVMSELERMFGVGELPEPSLLIDSGRGIWLLYLLHDPVLINKAHLGAYGDNPDDHLQLYTRINKALHDRLMHLGADPISDGVRHIRVPGSFRTDVGEEVRWRIYGRSDQVVSHTLKGLATALGIPKSRKAAKHGEPSIMRQPSATRTKAWKKTNENRLVAFLALKDLREGGFQGGRRNKAAFIFALSSRGCGISPQQAEKAVLAMGARCRPQLGSAKCQRAVQRGYKAKRVKLAYQTMADWLDVAPGEAKIITQKLYGDQCYRPRIFPAAKRFGPNVPATGTPGGASRSAKRLLRHEAIGQILAESGGFPGVRKMQAELKRRGIAVSVGTVFRDRKTCELAKGRGQSRA